MKISEYLDLRRIYSLKVPSEKEVIELKTTQREAIIKQMTIELAKVKAIPDAETFNQAILEREGIVSTGIGMGVAIPHAKLHAYDDFFIAIGILKSGINWDAIDSVPVRIIFMIGGPDDKQTEYLQILSRLTHVIRDEDRRKKMLNNAESPKQILELFDAF